MLRMRVCLSDDFVRRSKFREVGSGDDSAARQGEEASADTQSELSCFGYQRTKEQPKKEN